MRSTTVAKKCENCSAEMLIPFWLSKTKKFCSKKCYGHKMKKETDMKYKVVCLTCNKSFIKKSCTIGKYCSKDCYHNSKKRRIDYKCISCGEKTSPIKGVKRCFDCYKKYRVGDKHHNWIQDRTKLLRRQERGDSAYREWRRQVWLRDNFKCKIANQDCKGRLEAHHILNYRDYLELRYDVNNGITLCHAHHPRKRADEAKLSPYFQQMVAEMK